MIKRVVDLRRSLQEGKPVCDAMPGWYRWWCKKEAATLILGLLGIKETESQLLRKEIDGREYVAIYFGISKDLNGRIKWHICQNHTAGSIRSGFLSTLRQSLSALLDSDMSKSQQLVNNFIDDNSYLEYENTLTHKDAENIEKAELSHEYYYPLNIAGAKSTPKYIKDNLTTLRKTHKK